MDDDELFGLVVDASDAFEAYSLREFKVWRRTRDGGQRELLVTVLDAGPDAGSQRYSVEVRPVGDTGEESQPHSLSNSEGTIQDALSGVHWNKFDVAPN